MLIPKGEHKAEIPPMYPFPATAKRMSKPCPFSAQYSQGRL